MRIDWNDGVNRLPGVVGCRAVLGLIGGHTGLCLTSAEIGSFSRQRDPVSDRGPIDQCRDITTICDLGLDISPIAELATEEPVPRRSPTTASVRSLRGSARYRDSDDSDLWHHQPGLAGSQHDAAVTRTPAGHDRESHERHGTMASRRTRRRALAPTQGHRC